MRWSRDWSADVCSSDLCTGFSRSYLHHLVRAKESLGPRLLSVHNLHYYLDLVGEARAAIRSGNFEAWAQQTFARWRSEERRVGKAPNAGWHASPHAQTT